MIKLIDLNQIYIDEAIYPRVQMGWLTSYDYSESMKAGAKFSPIVVNQYAGKYYLIDGRHRMDAYKKNKVKSVKCEVLKLRSIETMFQESIRRNISNGRALSPQDKALVVGKLTGMNFTLPQISKIVQIPIDKIQQFSAERITSSVTGEEIYVKAPFIEKGESIGIVNSTFSEQQKVFSAHSDTQVISQMLRLLEIGKINLKNPKTLNDLKIIRKLIGDLVLKKYKKK